MTSNARRSAFALIWFLGGFPLDPTHLYFFSTKHESQGVFNGFKFGGVLFDKRLTAEVAEGSTFNIHCLIPYAFNMQRQYAT